MKISDKMHAEFASGDFECILFKSVLSLAWNSRQETKERAKLYIRKEDSIKINSFQM